MLTLLTKQGNYIKARYELIKGIPLTAEWLERCGFMKADDDSPWFRDKDFNEVYLQGDTLNWDYEGKTIATCKYLHQLQSLYFALTGTELEIK